VREKAEHEREGNEKYRWEGRKTDRMIERRVEGKKETKRI
jgi:hypothetical protein